MKKLQIAAIVLVLLAVVIPINGEDTIEKIEALLVQELNFEVDGEVWEPKDVDGSPLTPILYNDRTYVPVRSLLEDKGVGVGYVADTKTVTLDYSTIDRPIPFALTKTTVNELVSGGQEIIIDVIPNINFDEMTKEERNEVSIEDMTVIEFDNEQYSLEEFLKLFGVDQAMLEEGLVTGELDASNLPEEKQAQWPPERVIILREEEKIELVKFEGPAGPDVTPDPDDPAQTKIKVEVSVEGPPWKIKITFKF